MSHSRNTLRKTLGLSALMSSTLAAATFADGTETLGAPSLAIAEGNELVIAGVGLVNGQPDMLQVEIPEGSTVVQAIAYWEGIALTATEQGPTDTITLGGLPITGTRIGGPTHIIGANYTSTYRADITNLGVLVPGLNALPVGGFDFLKLNDGLGLALILDDGGDDTSIEIRDGNDYAFEDFLPPLDEIVAQTFSFEASEDDREAEISLMMGHISDFRSSVIEIYIDGELSDELLDVVGDLDGAEWDTYVHSLTVPAGATSVGVRPVSRDSATGPKAGNGTASITSVFAALELTTPQNAGDEGCSPWFWALRPGLWGGWWDNDVTGDIKYYDSFNGIMGVSRYRTGLHDCHSMLDALWWGGGWWYWHRLLNRHAAAALVNADSGIDYPYSVDEVVALYRDAVNADEGPETVYSTLVLFALANWQSCPLH